MSPMKLYARKEPAQDREKFAALTDVSNWFDTCLYRDPACEDPVARFPHDQEATPQEGDKTATVNCGEYTLKWLPRPVPWVVVFEDWDDGDIYDHTQTNDCIRAGDILVMLNKKEGDSKQERRVGLMYGAWPVILVGESDRLHSPLTDASDWLTMVTEKDPRNKAAAPLLKVLMMNPGADLDELLRGAERISPGHDVSHLRPSAP